MKRGIDNGKMFTDLDANNFIIRNAGMLDDPSLVHSDDSRLTDARAILDGSVTTDSVAEGAGIVQSKLNLNGDIPSQYLGTTAETAAPGDEVLLKADKDQIDGYAALNANSKMTAGTVATSGTGTVTDIHLLMRDAISYELVSTTLRDFTLLWEAQAAETWLGNLSGDVGVPRFESLLSVALVPNLDAAKITSGFFPVSQLPVAVGVGPDHAVGMLEFDQSASAHSSDYYARDGTWKTMSPPVSYQPKVPAPSITVLSYYSNGKVKVDITEITPGTNVFYSVNDNPFAEIFSGTLPLNVTVGDTVRAYAAKVGYDDSNIVSFVIPPTPNQ